MAAQIPLSIQTGDVKRFQTGDFMSLTYGGTGANITADNGGIVYSTASALAILASTATANKMLLSGASGAPTWSTSTMPSSAGTAGKLLVSDGTNYVLSTPTYPNASATSGKMIQSDGTNFVASTSVFPATVAGAGQILRASGANTWAASTNTYPDTAAAGSILYASGANIIGAWGLGTANQIVGVNNGATTLENKSILGTSNQVVVTHGAGTITLSTPQNLNTTATPTFNQVTITNTPSAATDAANKAYVDGAVQGLKTKPSARAGTTAVLADAYTASGTPTVLTRTGNGAFPAQDGVTLTVNQLILIKDETGGNQKYNGLYQLSAVGSAGAPWTLTRIPEADTWVELTSAYVWVSEGTINADSGWTCTIDAGGTLDTTAITWTLFASAGSFIAGAGLTKTGNTVDVVTASSARIVVNTDNIDLATVSDGGTGTFVKVTRDSYGRITGTTAVTAGDIAALGYTSTQPSLTNANAGAIVIGMPVYASAAGSVDKAVASASATSKVVGIVSATSIASSASGTVATDGVLTATTGQWDAVAGTTGGLAAGQVYYLSPTTAGQLTSAVPSSAGTYVAPILIGLSTTMAKISIQLPVGL